ncbi:MAG: addiction module antidote protein, HigA family [Candidatus Cloacimonetes bacterium 4572_55]|nr:MAG: addiction module antidote protein, HigA family [Candidatus Cloacimonetes bacterium 4572_55]
MEKEMYLDPIPPGEILREDFMIPYEISINQLGRDLDVPPNRISGIVNGKHSITADTALRLECYFGVEAQFWLNLQSEYDLRIARRKSEKLIKERILSHRSIELVAV